MALGPSSWVINSMWDAVFVGLPFVVPQTYIQFHSADPGSGGAANIVALGRYPAFFERDTDGHWRTAGAPMEVFVDIATANITHISVHNAPSGGNWIMNMVGNQPISMVEGDTMILSDLIQWTVVDWIA